MFSQKFSRMPSLKVVSTLFALLIIGTIRATCGDEEQSSGTPTPAQHGLYGEDGDFLGVLDLSQSSTSNIIVVDMVDDPDVWMTVEENYDGHMSGHTVFGEEYVLDIPNGTLVYVYADADGILHEVELTLGTIP